MRVIAGRFRSRLLKSLKGGVLRPTSDRLRETLFNVLGAEVDGSRFLDVFAGTGAIGIEALSRGAQYVAFVEKHGPAASLIRKNLESLQVHSGFSVIHADAVSGMEVLAKKIKSGDASFDYAFVDPPYDVSAEYPRAMRALASLDLLAVTGLIIAEHRKTVHLPEVSGPFVRVRVLRQGEAALSFYRRERGVEDRVAVAENP